MYWSHYLITCSVLATLLYASYRDVKYRDIPEVTWVPATALSIVLNVIQGNYDLIHTLLSLMPAALILIMSLLDLVGGADFLALLMISLAYPRFLYVPISFLTLIYSLIIPLLIMAYYAVINVVRYRDHLRRIKCLSGRKWYLIIFGRPMKISEFLKGSFIYPLTVPADNYEGFLCRATFNDDEEEREIREKISNAVRMGELRPNELIWVTPGLPHVLFFLIGLVLSLITPQWLIASLIIR